MKRSKEIQLKRIRAVMPNYASFEVSYKDEDDLKRKICQHLEIEPEYSRLMFLEEDGDPLPIDITELDKHQNDPEKEPLETVIVDYIWARQMIVLKKKQKMLRAARALVVGAGALGNEIVKNLAWIGFGEIVLVDYDTIELSNVSRGLFEKEDIGSFKAEVLAGKLGKTSPYVKITPIASRVEECREDELKCDVILSALDNMPTRLWLSAFAVNHKIPLIDGGIKEFQGRVQTCIPKGPCLACNIPLARYAEMAELKNPCEGLDDGVQASFSTISSIVAGVQANEAMKLVVGLPILEGVLIMDFLHNKYNVMPLARNPQCFVCGKDALKSVNIKGDGRRSRKKRKKG